MKASGYERVENDWYVEPIWATEALLEKERFLTNSIYDPCCGQGNILKAFQKIEGKNKPDFIYGSDIVDRRINKAYKNNFCFLGEQNFLEIEKEDLIGNPTIVCNPPYNSAQDFINKSLELGIEKTCVLLRLAFLEGQKRQEWFKSVPLRSVYVFSKRLSMPPGGSDIDPTGGSIAYAWFVFVMGQIDKPMIDWI